MNREEASFILANIDRRVCDDELNEALDMAIKVLEQKPTDDATLKDIFCMGCEYKEQEPCDNAVSRQDVLDLAKKGVLISNGNYESVCKAVNELPPVNPTKTGHWIPVSERLPKENGLYLVYTEEQPFVCPFTDGEFFIDEVLAWMPLPKPYEPQERSDKG